MPKISYVNGKFLPHDKAVVPIEDRGLQFSDAVYEVVSFFDGRPLDMQPHLDRLNRSLDCLSMDYHVDDTFFHNLVGRLIAKNDLSEGIVYIQITRGVAPRDHAFPKVRVEPTVIATARALDMAAIRCRLSKGVKIITTEENRWTRPDIKSTSLLGNVLAKEAAARAGAYEAVYFDCEGNVTEGTSSNVWIVNRDGLLVTRKTDGRILPGVTRLAVIKALGGNIKGIEERLIPVDELKAAREIFLTSTTSFVMPVVHIDDRDVGDGTPGKVTKILQKNYWQYIKDQTGFEAR